MGVNIYLLDRRFVRLSVAGVEHQVGTLRRFWKLTEMDADRVGEYHTSEAAADGSASPIAVMLAEGDEIPLASPSATPLRAHLVLGWDEGRTSVTDMCWDYLPVIGYAVHDAATDRFVLYESADGIPRALSRQRAFALGLTGADGHLLRRGPATIAECRSVAPFIDGYAEADCTLSDARREKVLVGITNSVVPQPSWFIGKSPTEVARFPPEAELR